jgi:triacylglycerol lipase
LAHGLLGFERIRIGRWTLATYFRGIPEYLAAHGVRVYVPRVHPTAGVERRARKLGERIEARFPGEKVHIIGHSFGGLDARQLAADPEWQGRVLSLTTVATPHLGSSLAIAAGRRLGFIYRLLRTVGWDHQGFYDIVPDNARAWHERTSAPPELPCFTVAGDPAPDNVSWPLRSLHRALARLEGPNDGLVSVASTRAFGVPLPTRPIDHFQQMNWYTGTPQLQLAAEVRRLYRSILRAIAPYDVAGDEGICAAVEPAVAGISS